MFDYGCPIKLQEVQLINGDGDFITKSFSVLGSQSTDGPWKSILTGEMGADRDEVSLYFKPIQNLIFCLNIRKHVVR